MTHAENKNPIERIAAIDLGTNSFHAVLVDIYSDGSFRVIDKLKEMVILAEKGMNNHLNKGAVERGLEALKRIKFLCDSQKVERIIAYATSAIREANNGGEFIKRISTETGIRVQAISGKMEAEMIGLAVKHSIALNGEMVLMVDIGGGSTEFIIGNNEKFEYMCSLKLGVARMAAGFINNDPITSDEIKNLQNHFQKELEQLSSIIKNYKVDTIIGSSGTMENIAAMIVNQNGNRETISLNEEVVENKKFQKFYKKFIKLNHQKRKGMAGLDEKRIDIINPGLVLVKYLLDEYDISTIKISEGALRDGMIINYINNKVQTLSYLPEFSEPRERSIYELLRKCNWQALHSTQVSNLALTIFDVLRDELDLPESDRELLKYASLLHDIGYHISHRKHHKHAYYLIRNSDLKGFTTTEIELMGLIARYHRRARPSKKHREFEKLSKDHKKRVKKLASILRVADGLDRSHYQNVQELEVLNSKNKITLHIYTEGDPQLEIWGALRKAKLLEKVTGKKLEIFAVKEKGGNTIIPEREGEQICKL